MTDGIADHAGWHNWRIDIVAPDLHDPNNGAIIHSSGNGAAWSLAAFPF